MSAEDESKGSFQCPICYDSIKVPALLYTCEHVFCSICILKWIESQQDKTATCPFCREKIDISKNPMVIIKPKYQSFSSFNSENGASLIDLRQKLTKQTKTTGSLLADYNQKEEKQNIQLETLDRSVKNVRIAVKELETELSERTTTLNSMPNTSACLDRVSDAVFSSSTKINATDSYDNIKMEWNLARDQYNGRQKRAVDLVNTRKQIKQTQNRNIMARTAISEFGPEEFSRRISKETFERLCAVMKWDHRDFSTPKSIARTAPMKRPFSSSKQSQQQPKKAKTMSFFDEDLISMDDDMF